MERCAPLAWARSQTLIEAEAPHDVSVKWAATVWMAQERLAAQVTALREVSRWFAAHAVPYVVLKGMPLAQRLYHVAWARPTDDVDIYIPSPARDVALSVFAATGWTHITGAYPGDILFRKVVDGYPVAVDVHFTLAGPWHRHLPPGELTVETCSVEGMELRALGGAILPVYLAAHLMHHDRRPLLWFADFTTLIESLNSEERANVIIVARRARLHRVLKAALRWSTDLDELSSAPVTAAEEQFIRTALRPTPSRAIAQLLWTSASPGDVAGVLSQFLWPRELRATRGTFVKFWTRRARRLLARIAR